ncbi:hypothetical protein E2I00_007622, partial [Balaenoptera physalus]
NRTTNSSHASRDICQGPRPGSPLLHPWRGRDEKPLNWDSGTRVPRVIRSPQAILGFLTLPGKEQASRPGPALLLLLQAVDSGRITASPPRPADPCGRSWTPPTPDLRNDSEIKAPASWSLAAEPARRGAEGGVTTGLSLANCHLHLQVRPHPTSGMILQSEQLPSPGQQWQVAQTVLCT